MGERLDLRPSAFRPHTYSELRVYPMAGYVEARIIVDSAVIATGVGATLGEALMVAGAMMTGTQVLPMHSRFLRAVLGKRRP